MQSIMDRVKENLGGIILATIGVVLLIVSFGLAFLFAFSEFKDYNVLITRIIFLICMIGIGSYITEKAVEIFRNKKKETQASGRGNPNLEKVNIYLNAMSMENSLLQSYRALFIAIEAALLASALVLPQFFGGDIIISKIVNLVSVIGLVVGVMWIIVCCSKGEDVDKWGKQIKSETNTDLYNYFSYMWSGFGLTGGRVARWWFNVVMPLLIIALWIVFLIFR